jgi:RNA polymerase sigma-70 factor, ECF subfamily
MKEFAPEPAAPALGFEETTLPLLPRLQRYAYRLTGNAADGDDLLQTAYLNALKGWHTFKPGTDPARWLFTILRHTFYGIQRRAHEVLSLDEPGVESLTGTLYLREELERGAARWDDIPDLGPALDEAIAALPEDLQSLVLLVDVEGYTYEEAAGNVGVPIGTVRSRLYRARRMLQERLIRHAEDLGIRRERGAMHDAVVKPIDCLEAARRLWAYLDGELEVRLAAEVDGHLGECARCFGVSQTQRRFLDAVRDLSADPSAAADLRARLEAVLRTARASSDKK